MQAIFRGADDHPEAVDVVGLAFRIDDSDAGQALLRPFAGEAKRIGGVCAWVRTNAPSSPGL